MERDGLGWKRFCRNGGESRAQAVAAYQRFVQDGLKEGHREDLYEVMDQRYLGDEAFVQRVEERVLDREAPQVVEIRWAEVTDSICKQFGMPPSAVSHRGRRRENARVKRVVAWVGREVGGFTNREVAKELGQDPAALSRGLGKLADELVKDQQLRRLVEKLCDTLRKGRWPKRVRSIRHAWP